ncbi:transposase, partial [Glaesserella parasuis]|nr:transposase [Glaesserella parasuis]
MWTDYTIGKQTYKQLAEKYRCSIRTIQRYIEKSPKAKLIPLQQTYLK